MGRKHKVLSPQLEKEIAARRARGESAQSISAALGGAISHQTLRNRWAVEEGRPKGLRPSRGGKIRPAKPVMAPPPASSIASPGEPGELEGDAPPPDAPHEVAQQWLAKMIAAAEQSQAAGNLSALATFARLVKDFMLVRYRTAPIAAPNPNDNPDMIAARDAARNRMHTYLTKVLEEA